MIAKILSSASGFNGVNYNTNKIDNGKGELMLVANFSGLQALPNLRPEDYKNYLKMISNTNSRTELPQFHASISCKGREYNKDELTRFAVDWMTKMGYGRQPFLVVFHSDTANNHVHLVSTRVNQHTGKKINDSFEKLRAYDAIQSLLNLDNPLKADLEKVKEYSFSTEAQFNLLLEKLGYTIKSDPEKIHIIKYGKVHGNVDRAEIKRISKEREQDKKRIAQIKAIILKYKKLYNSDLNTTFSKLPGGMGGRLTKYGSQLTDLLNDKFGIDIVFHFSGDKDPYGYTLIDNYHKKVFKGSEIFALKELIENLVTFNSRWFSSIIEDMKNSKFGLDELDAVLKDNGFSRKNLIVQNKENSEIFKLSKSDFEVLSRNTKSATSYKVFNEEDREKLSNALNISPEQIMIEKKSATYKKFKEIHSVLLMSAIHNYSSVAEGIDSLNLSFVKNRSQLFLFDSTSNTFISLDQLLNKDDANIIKELFLDGDGLRSIGLEDHFLGDDFVKPNYSGSFNLLISDDIDDEQVLGKNRRKKGKGRTNTR